MHCATLFNANFLAIQLSIISINSGIPGFIPLFSIPRYVSYVEKVTS